MENQHQKISGYRDLSQGEIDLLNRIKSFGADINLLLNECRTVDVVEGKNGDAAHDLVLDEASRWRSIAGTHFQQGLMALSRSVAKPSTFA